MIHILVVEDEKLTRTTLLRKLEKEGYAAKGAGNGEEARRGFVERIWDLVLLDINLPDANGLDLLDEFHQEDPEIPIIMLTGNQAVEVVVAAMKKGAFNYLTKPFHLAEVMEVVQRALEVTELRREIRMMKKVYQERYGSDKVIGDSPAMKAVMDTVMTVAESEAPSVLLLGESGTGKNLIAQAIHFNSSRARQPFLEVTCTALSETLLESELFGHERGAFTDARTMKRGLAEMAHRGALFLDEIGDMPLGIQAKLLGFIESRKFRRVGGTRDLHVDVRIITATNRDLEERVLAKKFREDLYYRLNVIEIVLPPLRARIEDLELLTRAFIDRFNQTFKKKVLGITPRGLERLAAHSWPGNIRELRNIIERAMILTKKDYLTPDDFMLKTRLANGGDQNEITLPAGGIPLDRVEKTLVQQALARTRGNQTKAARLLDISRDQLRYRMKQYNLFDPVDNR